MSEHSEPTTALLLPDPQYSKNSLLMFLPPGGAWITKDTEAGTRLEIIDHIHLTSPSPFVLLAARAGPAVSTAERSAGSSVREAQGIDDLAVSVKAVLRHVEDFVADSPMRVANLELHPRSFSATVGGNRLALTLTEFKLLHQLARPLGKAFRRDELVTVTSSGPLLTFRTIDVHVRHLRHKLGEAGAVCMIETVRGVGYRLVEHV